MFVLLLCYLTKNCHSGTYPVKSVIFLKQPVILNINLFCCFEVRYMYKVFKNRKVSSKRGEVKLCLFLCYFVGVVEWDRYNLKPWVVHLWFQFQLVTCRAVWAKLFSTETSLVIFQRDLLGVLTLSSSTIRSGCSPELFI